MRPSRSSAHHRTRHVLIGAFALLLVLAGLSATASAANGTRTMDVRVVSDASGQKLQLDGEDYMIFGMNWGYMPIGENYMYSLWNQPDDIIESVLDREMPLLVDMGVNSIRQYVGIPPQWVEYIYERYGITTVINHTVARYGYTLDGTWIPSVDYSDPRIRGAVTAEIVDWAELYRDTPGILMWLLGNENNYGLHWSSFEIEALPEGERETVRARYLYTLYAEITNDIKRVDPGRLVAICNGDLQYIDIIAEECRDIDVLGTNVYRGISVRDLYDEVDEKLGIPVMFTEFGSDAYNAREMREDQIMQARYLVGQWEEIYEQSYGKGRVGNAVGGIIFQWSDGWWKFGQESRLDIHDTNASWPNGGYSEDYVPGQNNMNEEWWGITAKGPPNHRGLYDVYPRAAYYALRRAFMLDPYEPGTDIATIQRHFGAIHPAAAELEARGARAALVSEERARVHLAGLRLEFETINTGGERVTTPATPETPPGSPAFRGFDHLQSFYVDLEAKPTESVTGRLSLNVLGHVPENRIDEIFYENRGRARTITSDEGSFSYEGLERIKVYQASVSWDDPWFMLDSFYRTGHLHWGFEGDFFGLYRDAYYGENIDIYNGMAPVGVEIAGKRSLSGLKLAFGPQLWWGANPAILLKYTRQLGPFATTAVYHEDIAAQSAVNTSVAIPQPETRKVTLQAATRRGNWGLELGSIWSGSTKVGDTFQAVEELEGGGYDILQDDVVDSDALGFKGKVTWERDRWHWYAQGAHMGLVADAGPTETITYTGWHLKDSGSGNQSNVLTGLAVNVGDFQLGPNFLWQKPIIGPIPNDVPSPGRPRNVLADPFAVRSNREMVGVEFLVTYDTNPATWFWAWDNDIREQAPLAASLGVVFKHQPTTQDVSIFIAEDGVTTYAFTGAPPAQDLWEIHARIVSRIASDSRLVVNAYGGTAEPSGYDPSEENVTLNRKIERFGISGRLTRGPIAFATSVKINDWGPYDYHRDFNLTYPHQVMADISYSLGSPEWFFGSAQTRIGIQTTWRSLDEHSPRYCPQGGGAECDPTADGENGSEWEIRTYLHLAL